MKANTYTILRVLFVISMCLLVNPLFSQLNEEGKPIGYEKDDCKWHSQRNKYNQSAVGNLKYKETINKFSLANKKVISIFPPLVIIPIIEYRVYTDETNREWILLSPAESVYHGEGNLKFVSLDENGKGSHETVIISSDPDERFSDTIINDTARQLTSGPLQQTYNFYDLFVNGPLHVWYDVRPHKGGVLTSCESVYEDMQQEEPEVEEVNRRLELDSLRIFSIEHNIEVIGSRDPNDISGSSGFGSKKWISVNQLLTYKIRFENDPDSATAAAQKVIINLPLDSHMDIETFQFGTFGFGEFSFSDGIGQKTYDERLSVATSVGVDVDVTFEIDKKNKIATWIFESIDTLTGKPTKDPFAGFLPINDTTLHNGEGFVSFTIKPSKNAKTGDEILASADIIFDFNDPIKTNVWRNTIDGSSPNSSVISDIMRLDGYTYEVTWSGNDENGSGIKDYSIFYSDTTGIIKRWLENTSESSAEFTGELGNTYTFYSTSRDNVKNLEGRPDLYDAELVVSELTSIKNVLKKDFVKVYPNPSSCCFTIEAEREFASGPVRILVFDNLGRFIHSGNMQSESYNLDLSNYAKGIYFLQIFDSNQQINRKIILE